MLTGIDEGSSTEAALKHLVEMLLHDLDRIVEHAVEHLQAASRSYAVLAPGELAPVAATNISNLLTLVLDPDTDRACVERAYRESGEIRARQGVTSDEMLNGWRA